MAVEEKNPKRRLFPSWKEAINEGKDFLKREGRSDYAHKVELLINSDPPQLLEAAQVIYDSPSWIQYLTKVFDPSFKKVDSRTLELAKTVWDIGQNFIITTNFDRVLQKACPQSDDYKWCSRQTNLILDAHRQTDRRVVWHLHGYVDDPKDIVFARSQYEDFYEKGLFKSALKSLDSLLIVKSFLFVGFSLNDEYFRKRLEYINQIFGRNGQRHFILLPKNEIDGLDLGDYIDIIPFDGIGLPLLNKMKELAAYVDVRESPITLKTAAKKKRLFLSFGVVGACIVIVFFLFNTFAWQNRGSDPAPSATENLIPTEQNKETDVRAPVNLAGSTPNNIGDASNEPRIVLENKSKNKSDAIRPKISDPEKVGDEEAILRLRQLRESDPARALEEANKILKRDRNNGKMKKFRNEVSEELKAAREN